MRLITNLMLRHLMFRLVEVKIVVVVVVVMVVGPPWVRHVERGGDG